MKCAQNLVFIFSISVVVAKELELPLCPTSVQFLPQKLPMHCRMPRNAPYPFPILQSPSASGMYPSPPSFNFPQGKPADQASLPNIPPGLPGMPPGMHSMPPGMHGMPPGMHGMPPGIPGAPPMPPPGFPGAFPMPLPAHPGQKLPVIVMPFYSPDDSQKKQSFQENSQPLIPRPRKRRRRRRPHRMFKMSDTSSSSDLSSDEMFWQDRRNFRRNNMRGNKHKKSRQLLTPVLQYVTKDGYVIFEKKISKNEAKDWLSINHENKNKEGSNNHNDNGNIETMDHDYQNYNDFQDEEHITHQRPNPNNQDVETITQRNEKPTVKSNKATKKRRKT